MAAWSINRSVHAPLVLLGIVEASVLFSSVYFAILIVYGDIATGEEQLGPMLPRALIFAAVILTSLISVGLYQFHQRIYFREALVRVLVGVAVGFGALALVVLFYTSSPALLSRDVAFVAIAYTLIMLLLVRFYFVRAVDESIFRRKTLIYGAGEAAASISDLRRKADRRGFRIVGQLTAPGDNGFGSHAPHSQNQQSIASFAKKVGADEIVVAMDDRRGNLPVRELLDCRLQGIEVIDLLQFLERETGKIWVDLLKPSWLIFSPGFRVSRLQQINKRMVDILVSVAIMLLTWPVMLLVALAIKLEDGFDQPVFYRQSRVGKSGQLFELVKFRSMRVDAEKDGPVWAEKNDVRITRVGSVLRKTRLDELPQILKILRGQMSLVGPRPERPEFVNNLSESIPYYSKRHTVKPGLTGWAQLKFNYGASENDAVEKLQYDLYYVKNQSLLLDLTIILQTVEVVLWGKGAR
jgi:sugar transferase (PEP-CTERM system associated)